MNILNPLETIHNKGSTDILFLSQGSILHFTLGQPLFIAQYSQLSSLKIPSDTHKTLPSYFLPSLFFFWSSPTVIRRWRSTGRNLIMDLEWPAREFRGTKRGDWSLAWLSFPPHPLIPPANRVCSCHSWLQLQILVASKPAEAWQTGKSSKGDMGGQFALGFLFLVLHYSFKGQQ